MIYEVSTNPFFYPRREIIFRKKVRPVFSLQPFLVIIPLFLLQISDFSLKCRSCQLEVQSLLMVAL